MSRDFTVSVLRKELDRKRTKNPLSDVEREEILDSIRLLEAGAIIEVSGIWLRALSHSLIQGRLDYVETMLKEKGITLKK